MQSKNPKGVERERLVSEMLVFNWGNMTSDWKNSWVLSEMERIKYVQITIHAGTSTVSVLEYIPKGKVAMVVSFTCRKILCIWSLNVRGTCIFVPRQSCFSLGCTQSVLCLAVKMKALLQLMEVQFLRQT